MILHVLVARDIELIPWVVDAVDDWTRDSNPDSMHHVENEAKKQLSKSAEVRWLQVNIPDDALELVFTPRIVEGTVVEEKP